MQYIYEVDKNLNLKKLDQLPDDPQNISKVDSGDFHIQIHWSDGIPPYATGERAAGALAVIGHILEALPPDQKRAALQLRVSLISGE